MRLQGLAQRRVSLLHGRPGLPAGAGAALDPLLQLLGGLKHSASRRDIKLAQLGLQCSDLGDRAVPQHRRAVHQRLGGAQLLLVRAGLAQFPGEVAGAGCQVGRADPFQQAGHGVLCGVAHQRGLARGQIIGEVVVHLQHLQDLERLVEVPVLSLDRALALGGLGHQRLDARILGHHLRHVAQILATQAARRLGDDLGLQARHLDSFSLSISLQVIERLG